MLDGQREPHRAAECAGGERGGQVDGERASVVGERDEHERAAVARPAHHPLHKSVRARAARRRRSRARRGTCSRSLVLAATNTVESNYCLYMYKVNFNCCTLFIVRGLFSLCVDVRAVGAGEAAAGVGCYDPQRY